MNQQWHGAALLADSPEAQRLWHLGPVRLGYIDYLNCLPVYYGIERGIIDLPVAVKKGPPAVMNRMFLAGELDITPISAIEFARHHRQCVLLPDLSISADGPVASIFLFSRVPLSRVRRVALTAESATAAVLTRVILAEQYGGSPEYVTMAPELPAMLAAADAALLIGDAAMLMAQAVPGGHYGDLVALDLGAAWKDLTGEMMVYGLWVVQQAFADRSPEGVRLVARLLRESQEYGWAHREELVAEALRRRALPRAVVAAYFRTIRHGFGPEYRRGLRAFLELAQKIGQLSELPELRVWEDGE